MKKKLIVAKFSSKHAMHKQHSATTPRMKQSNFRIMLPYNNIYKHESSLMHNDNCRRDPSPMYYNNFRGGSFPVDNKDENLFHISSLLLVIQYLVSFVE